MACEVVDPPGRFVAEIVIFGALRLKREGSLLPSPFASIPAAVPSGAWYNHGAVVFRAEPAFLWPRGWLDFQNGPSFRTLAPIEWWRARQGALGAPNRPLSFRSIPA
jgi:hypothetical protein